MKPLDVLNRYQTDDLPEFDGILLVDLNQVGHFGNRPLHVACARSALEEVVALVSGGAEINSKGEHGNTPLHEAVGQNATDVVNYLLQVGADVTIRNDFQQTPLDIASLMKRESLISMIHSVLDHRRRGP